jgi:hypothetical protein
MRLRWINNRRTLIAWKAHRCHPTPGGTWFSTEIQMAKIIINADTNAAILSAINAGMFTDEDGADVRVTGQLSHVDHNGNPDRHAYIYRLWTPDSEQGMRFTVYEDGVIESVKIDSEGYAV